MPKMKFTKNNVNKVKHVFCVYSHYDKNGKRIRVGSTIDCKNRLKQQLKRIKAPYFSKKVTQTPTEARSLEKLICKRENPPLNQRC